MKRLIRTRLPQLSQLVESTDGSKESYHQVQQQQQQRRR
jgi:hypothetical protein